MLGKHHGIDMNERTLKRRLKDYGLRRQNFFEIFGSALSRENRFSWKNFCDLR
jgi:hypothetical protein